MRVESVNVCYFLCQVEHNVVVVGHTVLWSLTCRYGEISCVCAITGTNITLLLLVTQFCGLSHADMERFLVYVPSLGQTA